MSARYQQLQSGESFHVYNRAPGNEMLFLSDENYRFFLLKFREYILPVAGIYAWVLMPNHFHFLLRFHEYDTIADCYSLKKIKPLDPDDTSAFLMKCFSNFLNSYTKAFNKMYSRKGSLFMDYLKRVHIESEEQLGATAFYIHKNPVHHGYCKTMDNWKWSSYNSYINKEPTTNAAKELLEWFGGERGFREYHSQPIYLKKAVVLEE